MLSPLFSLLGTMMSITVSQAMLSCLFFFFSFKTWVSDFCFMLRIIVAFGREYFKLGEKAKTKKKKVESRSESIIVYSSVSSCG